MGTPVAIRRIFEETGHSYLHLILLVTVPAICWIGIFGLIGAEGLGKVGNKYLLMSVNQAMLLIACGLLLIFAIAVPRFKTVVAFFAVLLSGFGWVSDWFWPEWQAQRSGYTELALSLSLLSGIMMLIVRPVGGSDAFRPGRASLATAIIGTFFSAGAAYILVERDVIQIQERAQAQVQGLRNDVTASIASSVSAIERLAARWSTIERGVSPVFVQQEFESIVGGFDEIKRITYLDTDLAPRHDKIDEQPYAGFLEQALATPEFRSYLDHVIKTGQVHLAPAGQFISDPRIGFVIAGIRSGDVAQRLVVGTLDLEQLATQRLDPALIGCCYEITANGDVMRAAASGSNKRALAFAQDQADLHHDMTLGFRYWYEDSSSIDQPHLPEGILLFGLVFTFLANSSQRLTHVVRRSNLQLQHSALHDALTDLPNRRMLAQELRRIKRECDRDGSSLSVVFLELDGLRLISDTVGHEAADTLVIESAKRLRQALPEVAGLARLDSGDFVVYVSGMTEQEIEVLTRRLLSVVQEPLQFESNQLRVTAFAGISRSTDQQVEPMQMVRQADMAMLRARKGGYSAWRHYTPELGKQVNARLALYNDLQAAIDKGAMKLRLQPVVDGRTGAIASFEVLIRQPHPVKGEISPGVFIPMAEESGQILPLTDWLLSEACEQAKRLEAAGYGGLPLAVNISPRYFQTANFVERIRIALLRADVSPSILRLEITEGVLLDDAAAAIVKLQHLRDLGVEASLDDFGTGYSSLAYLRQLPISTIKIDQTFVRHVTSEPSDAAIVRGVIAMAHHLHLKVVAEGIETAAQFSFLQRSGCDLFQGYLFDRPLLIDDILALPPVEGASRELPTVGTPFGAPRTQRPFAILLAGHEQWSRPLAQDLSEALDEFSGSAAASRFVVMQADSGAHALAMLAQFDVDLAVVHDGLTDIGFRSILKKAVDMYPGLTRWVFLQARRSLQMTDSLEDSEKDLVHRFWALPADIQEMTQAILAIAREPRNS